ncbi:MAG: sensor histidine kinase [Pauljensenia sp.]
MKSPWIGTLIAVAFTVLTVPAWVSLLGAPEHAPYRTLATVLALTYAGTTIAAALLTGTGGPSALRVAAVGIVTALGAVLVGLLGIGSAPVLAGAICLMLVLLPRRTGIIAAAASLLTLGIFGFTLGTPDETVPNLVALLSVAVATALVLHLVEVHEELLDAKEAIADLAVLRERERLSRDLHDVLGSTATTIALKARLASELVSREQTGRVRDELVDIGRLASTISRDIREAVRDLRRVTLEAELSAAGAAIDAAGIRLDVRRSGVPEPQFEPVLAMVIREAVTNAVRHADATLVSVTVDTHGVTITDDGHGAPITEGDGIRGMRDRLTSCGGIIEVTGAHRTGTTVTARLP